MPRKKKVTKLEPYEPFTTVDNRGVPLDVAVSVSVRGHEPMLFVGDLVFPITRAKAWVLLFGPDEDIERVLTKNPTYQGVAQRNHKRKVRDLDKPSESTGVINRRKKNRQGLCGIKECKKKHRKGSMWCLGHLKKMRATVAIARAKKTKKEPST